MNDPAGSAGTEACIGLGSNLGDRSAHLGAAIEALAAVPGVRILAVSAPIETAPVGPPGQGPYLNAAARIRTTLEPAALLASMLAIECDRGRRRDREPRWGPRTLDLDLLLFGDRMLAIDGLEVPHPRMHERDFVLRPLAEIAPEFVHPALARTVRELLADLSRGLTAPE